MKKDFFILTAAVLFCIASAVVSRSLFKEDDASFLKENVEALADSGGMVSIGDKVRDFIGCPGGNAKCFSGEVTIKGVTVSGTWYIELN